MKKILVSILAVFYLTSTVGATVHLHYCMDKFINWSLLKGGDKCSKCGMEKDGGCCKDENKFVKNDIDQKVAESSFQLIQMAAVTSPAAFIHTTEYYVTSITQENPFDHAPPRSNSVGIYILNSVFRL
jgi:hypothetical protein